ncbi:MAG: ATP-binding protein [Candidatus Binatia bacterium]
MATVQSSRHVIDSTSQWQKAIAQLGRAMASNLDLTAIFHEFVSGIKDYIPFDRVLINQVDAEGKISRLFLLSSVTDKTAGDNPVSYEGGNTVTEWVVREKKPFIREDTLAQQEFETDRRLSRLGFRSYINIPLIYSERVVGSFHIAAREPSAYGERESGFLMSVAEWLAVAMENARLFQETHRLYEELQRLNQDLERVTQNKSQFFARLSHEMRTPLSVIIGFIDFMNAGVFGVLSEQQKSILNKIQIQSQTLLKMANDVLNLSRIEAGAIHVEASTFPIDTVIESLQALTEDLQRKSRLEVKWDIEPKLPLMTSDSGRLEEILQNLIVNAFKYTSEGEVRIRIRNRPETQSVEFAVEDTGRGIAPENISKIFGGFHQVSPTATSQGVGLGLTIVKKYVELLKGEIQVESELGKGSKFTVTLPCVLQTASISN